MPLGWAALLNAPQNRLEAVRPVVERLGGSILQVPNAQYCVRLRKGQLDRILSTGDRPGSAKEWSVAVIADECFHT